MWTAEGPKAPVNRKAGVIESGILHVVLYAPPFLMGYAREGDTQDYVFTSPFSTSTSFDFDISQSRLYLIGSVKGGPPPDERPTLLCYSSPKALEAKHTTIKGTNERTYTTLELVHAMDPSMIFKERIKVDANIHSTYFACPSLLVDRTGFISGAVSSDTSLRLFSRQPIVMAKKPSTEPLEGAYKQLRDLPITQKAIGLLPIGATGHWYALSSSGMFDSRKPQEIVAVPADFIAIWDKDTNCLQSIRSPITQDMASISQANASLVARYAVLQERLGTAIQAAQTQLGYK